jgi:competence protein ComEC
VFVPLFWISVAFLAGIVLAAHVTASIVVWLTLAFASLVLIILRIRLSAPTKAATTAAGESGLTGHIEVPRQQLPPPRRQLLVFTSLLFLFLGAARYQLTVPQSSIAQVAWFNDRKYDVLVTGTLVDPPDYRDTYTNLHIQAQSLNNGKKPFKVGGLLLARVPVNQVYQYGQNVRLRGRLETPPENEDFSYRDYLARQNIHSYMPDAEVTILPGTSANPVMAAVYDLKQKLLDNIYRIFIDPEASLLAGILLGIDTGLPDSLQQAFKDTGTAHIIAISGFNIAIIAGLFILIFSRLLGPRRGAIAAVIGILFYTVLVGATPAVVRAAIMGVLALFAVQVGRRQMGLNTLAFVAAIMALWNPLLLWDAGFQLSFFATLGLILYGSSFQTGTEKFLGRYLPQTNAAKAAAILAEVVLLTFAAQITTLPIMAYQFKQISLVSFLANPFILPAQPAVMILGGLAAFASLLLFPVGRLLALFAWPLTAYTIRMVELFDAIPHGVIYLGGFSAAFVVLFYAVLLTATLGGSRLKQLYKSLQQRFRFFNVGLVLAALFVCTLLIWRFAAGGPDGKLHVTFLNVGSADAVLVQTPSGRNILINGGPSTSALSDALGRRLSPINPALDWLIMASTDEQQVAALPRILPRYPPKNVLIAGNPGASISSRAVMQWLDGQEASVTQAETGQLFDLGDGALLRVDDVSPRGATLLISWNDFHMLLPIGANLDTFKNLQNGAAIGPVDVLSLSQSGYAPLTPPEWIQNLDPRLAVISVGAGDINNRPDKSALEALGGRSVLRTDRNGWIDISTDGKQMWVTVERKPEDSK